MPPIIDERTLAGWLSGPTERRAAVIRASATAAPDVLVEHADVEEHVLDPLTGTTRRCDVTLRDERRALLSAEIKRPEVASVDDPALIADAHQKALHRGLEFYATCNMAEVALWATRAGSHPAGPLLRLALAPGLTHSSQARARRSEIEEHWQEFMGIVEGQLREAAGLAGRPRPLPPQVADLRNAIAHVADEASVRLASEVALRPDLRELIIATFNHQFGVELVLNAQGNRQRYNDECHQVAMIACFVVATRLVMYRALEMDRSRDMDPLELPTSSDPRRVQTAIDGLLVHAKERTRDFQFQLTPNVLDDIAFVQSPSTDVGARWAALAQVVSRSDWTGPAEYVPGLYESLLDEQHRHLMGVHYTPETVAETIAAYAVREATDVVLDPACGAGTFVTLAYQRKRRLGSSHEQALEECYGVEIADFAAALTGLGLALGDANAASAYPRVVKADFFTTAPGSETGLTLPSYGAIQMPHSYDAVIGNPPYIRFESRSAEERAAIHDVLFRRWAAHEVAFPDFTGKADLWAFFVAHAHAFLADGGRLGLVLSWSLLCTDYGDAVVRFLTRHFHVDAIIDSRVERFFAAKQNTVILLAEKVAAPPNPASMSNPNVDPTHPVRFIRLKQPLDRLVDLGVTRGKRAEDLVDELLSITADVEDDIRWDVRVLPQGSLSVWHDRGYGGGETDASDDEPS
jgi:hypothetical protein